MSQLLGGIPLVFRGTKGYPLKRGVILMKEFMMLEISAISFKKCSRYEVVITRVSGFLNLT